jgi:hypothetical protein
MMAVDTSSLAAFFLGEQGPDVEAIDLIPVYHNQQWCIKEPLRWQQIQTTIGKNASKPL